MHFLRSKRLQPPNTLSCHLLMKISSLSLDTTFAKNAFIVVFCQTRPSSNSLFYVCRVLLQVDGKTTSYYLWEVFFAKNYSIFFAIRYANICYPGNHKLVVKEIKSLLQSILFLSHHLVKSSDFMNADTDKNLNVKISQQVEKLQNESRCEVDKMQKSTFSVN